MTKIVDRLKVKTTIIAEYDIIPMGDLEATKASEQDRSMEDMISLLRSMTPNNVSYSVEFEEVSDIPE